MIDRNDKVEKEFVPEVVVTASDGRRIGVRVVPFRCTPIMSLLDLDNYPWMFGRSNLPATTNEWVNAVADFIADNSDYGWDTPQYRALCIAGGLDPDHHRPRFADVHAEAGDALVNALCRHSEWPDHSAVNIVFDLVDVLRIDPWRGSTTVNDVRSTVRFNARYHPAFVQQAVAMIDRATDGRSVEIEALLGLETKTRA